MPIRLVVGGLCVLCLAPITATARAAGEPMMGPAHSIAQPSFQGYYDGHKDTYLST